MLFYTEFVDGEGLNGQNDMKRMDGICDFMWEKFVIIKSRLMVQSSE